MPDAAPGAWRPSVWSTMPEDTTTTATDLGGETAEVDPAATETPEPEQRPNPRTVARRAATSVNQQPAVDPEAADPWADFEWDGKAESLPAPLAKIVREARAGEAKARTVAKQNAAAEAQAELTQRIGRALGLITEDEPADPAKLLEQIQEHQASAWRSGVELRVHRTAARLGADPDALLDSMSFINTLDDLVDSDASSAEFATALEEKIREAVEKNPAKYKLATGQEPAAPAQNPAPASRRPVESLRPGAAPGSSTSADDPNDWLRNRLRNRG